MANEEIKALFRKKRVRQYEVAEMLGIHESVFCRVLRKELDPERQKQIIEAVNKVVAEYEQ